MMMNVIWKIDAIRYLGIMAFSLCLAVAGTIRADSGPELPCVGCPEFLSNPVPQTGIWFNPHESGTGFMLQVQSRMVAGYYYLYDENGLPIWFLLVGKLEQSDDPDVSWTLNAQLEKLEGGSCLNCPYQAPMPVEPAGEIRFEFMQRNFARFQVNGGRTQNIWTITYGVGGSAAFTPATDYLVPDLSGRWVFSLTLFTIRTQGVFLEANQESEALISYTIFGSDPFAPAPPAAIVGDLHCGALGDAEGPMCEIRLDEFPDSVYRMPLGNLGPSRMVAESEDGTRVLHGHRLDFD